MVFYYFINSNKVKNYLISQFFTFLIDQTTKQGDLLIIFCYFILYTFGVIMLNKDPKYLTKELYRSD